MPALKEIIFIRCLNKFFFVKVSSERTKMIKEKEDIQPVELPQKIIWIEVKERNVATNEVKVLHSYVVCQLPASV